MTKSDRSRPSAVVLLLALAVSLVTSALLQAADPAAPAGKSETIKLFNGKDFTGWAGDVKYWSIVDGVIVGKSTAKVPVSTYLITDGKYTDFRLLATVKLVTSEVHSGIAMWGHLQPDKGDPYTYAGLLVMFPSNWGFFDLHERMGLPVDGGPAKAAGKQHDWNDLEILAQGNRVRLVVNGKQVVDYREPDPAYVRSGPIGLQLHSNDDPQEIHFKGLELTTFPEDKLLTVKE
jgi:Domain of Unknown Function (DUF1080)